MYLLKPLYVPGFCERFGVVAVCLWLCASSQVAAGSLQLALPKHRLHAAELAVIVNDADPLSVRIGEYYMAARNIPEGNLLHVSFPPGQDTMSAADFERLRSAVQQATPAHVQAYAITWRAPYRVDCMSFTSALSLGFERRWCSAQRCSATGMSPYFNYQGTTPYHDLGIRPSMSIAAKNFEDARALIDRGIAADASRPSGSAYLVSTRDKARNVRAVRFPRLADAMQDWISTEIVVADALRDRHDVLFYFTGKARVNGLETLTFLPGAVADHLTSSGGKLSGLHMQMSALSWLQAGATGSYGTVVEPCNLLGKFPDPAILMESYGRGSTLIEAYWRSVQQPGEGIFIGEPLAAPFDGVRVEHRGENTVVHTRTLAPGNYQLSIAVNPVGPYRRLPGQWRVRPFQQELVLPGLGEAYYRLTRVDAASATPDPG